MDGTDATLPDTGDLAAARTTNLDFDTRYEMAAVLGRGGMGEVRRATDRRIGRDVAVKLMRPELRDDEAMSRFFREAHLQGVLDHPSIVPVHDVGVDGNGNPFFVMKRVAGTTLSDILDGKSGGMSRAKILARFVDVCFAIDYAHSNRIIHRDLKPSNIMFGDYGETYVLDWGIARRIDSRRSVANLDTMPAPIETLAGELMGTPGYMSPEQARGEEVGPPTDIYALGCVLHEILVGKPALPRGLAAIEATLRADCHRPSDHAADVDPELNDLVMRATRRDAGARPTARELAESVQAHLEGDRDLERRRTLAEHHAQKADAEPATTDESRASAMREAGRALALDPENALAQRILGGLMLAAPTTIPREALAAADDERGRTRQQVLRMAATGYFSIIAAIVILLLLPVAHRWQLIVTGAIAGLTGAVALLLSRWVMPMKSPWFLLLLVLNCAMITMSGVMFTPLLVMPIFIVGSLTGWLQQPTGYSSWVVVAAHVIPFVALLALELLGILPSTFTIVAGDLVVSPPVIELTPTNTLVIFGITFAIQVTTTGTVMVKNRFSQQAEQDRQHAHAWHLQQLMPRRAP